MRVLVTGGNGFVGRELCRLLAEEHEVGALDLVSQENIRFAPKERDDIEFISADIRVPQAADTVAAFAPDAVVHLAAMHFIPDCEQDPGQAVATNVLGTVNMLAACAPGTIFVFASSGAVYAPSSTPHNELTSAVVPQDVYGLTKAQGEAYMRYLAAERGLRAVIVRLFNVVGPGETNPHVLPDIVAQLKAGHRRLNLGNLEPRRDYLHIQDAAGGFRAATVGEHPAVGESVTVNLGTSVTHSVRDLIDKLSVLTGDDIEVSSDPARVRAVDRPVLSADINAFGRRFGWTPKHSIDDALRDLWREPDLAPALLSRYQQ